MWIQAYYYYFNPPGSAVKLSRVDRYAVRKRLGTTALESRGSRISALWGYLNASQPCRLLSPQFQRAQATQAVTRLHEI